MSRRTQTTPGISETRGAPARTGWLMPALLLALLVPWYFCGTAVDRASAENKTGPGSVRAGEFFGTVVSGGFRAVFIDYLWMRANIQNTRNQYYELHATYDALAYFQPHAEEVWVYNSNTMADIATQYQTTAAQYAWLRAGVAFGVKGLEYNPDSAIIRRHLAHMFYYKFSYEYTSRSREFRRLLREDPDKSFLRDPGHPSPVHESLLYWDDLVASAPDDLVHQNRCYAALVLLWEQETGKREARIDMLDAREKYLLSPPDEAGANGELFEKRKLEYEAALAAPPQLRRAEENSLREKIKESLDYLEGPYGANSRITGAIRTWENGCREVLAQIDIVLELYEKALNAIPSGIDPSTILTAENVKTLESRDMNDILPVNGSYATRIYYDAVQGLKRLLEKKESER